MPPRTILHLLWTTAATAALAKGLRSDLAGGRVLDAADASIGVAATTLASARVLMISQNLGAASCSPLQADALKKYKSGGNPNGPEPTPSTCSHDVIVVSTQESGAFAESFANDVLAKCGFKDASLFRSSKAEAGQFGFLVSQTVFVRNSFLAKSTTVILDEKTSETSLDTTAGLDVSFTKKAVRSTMRWCAAGSSTDGKNCPSKARCRLQFVGVHMPMRPDSETSPGFAYGLEKRTAAMETLKSFRATSAGTSGLGGHSMAETDATLLMGDTNFRVDNQGEQLLRQLHAAVAGSAYYGWAEPKLPSYYTCRFAEAEKAVNKDEPSYTACRKGKVAGPKRPVIADLVAGKPNEVTNYAIQDNAADKIDRVTGGIAVNKAARGEISVYKERYATCGTGEKEGKNRPLGYCDRILYRKGAKTVECGFGIAPTYTHYDSVLLCPSSDHNAVVADIALSWIAL